LAYVLVSPNGEMKMSPRPVLGCEVRIVTGGGEVGVAASAAPPGALAAAPSTTAAPRANRRHRRRPLRDGVGVVIRGMVLPPCNRGSWYLVGLGDDEGS
jgi:hypothetical protein